METPLEVAVRTHLQSRYEPMAERNPRLDVETVAQIIDQKTDETAAILRETLSDEAIPTESDLFRAEIEATRRQMRGMVEKMRDPERLARLGDDPRKLEVVRTLADNAEEAMSIFGTLTPDMTQAQLDEATEKLKGHWTGLAARIEGEPPAPQ